MQAHFRRPVREPLWIAGIAVCLLTVSSAVAIVRAIPASYASIPDQGARSRHGAAPSGSEDAQALLATARASDDRRNRPWCAECGVVDSMRQVERSGHIGGHDAVDVKVAGGSGALGRTVAASATKGKSYEFTVRFRDGSKTVFNEATPRTWRPGSRVIVIDGAKTSNN